MHFVDLPFWNWGVFPTSCCIAVLVFAGCQHRSAQSKPSIGQVADFATPSEAWQAYCDALRRRDGAKALATVTARHRNAFVFDAWERQFHFLSEPKILGRFINEKKRQELTRRYLPIYSYELSLVLIQSIDDPDAAFVALINDMPESLREGIASQDVTAFVTKEETAVGSDGESGVVQFVREPGAWKIDANYPADLTEMLVEGLTSGWKDLPSPQFSSPQEVYSAYDHALESGDAETAWHCLTVERRNSFLLGSALMLVEGGGGDSILGWYCSAEKSRAARERGADESASEFDRERALAKSFADSLYDQRTFLSAIVRRMNDEDQHLDKNGLRRESERLQDVVVTEQRARGLVKKYFWIRAGRIDSGGKDEPTLNELDSYDDPYYFVKTKTGWLIDLPTESEQRLDDERDESM